MTHTIKAIFLDLDGTSLRPNHTFPPTLLTTLKKLQERAVEIIIATGRSYASSQRFAKALGGSKYIINYNGASITALENETLVSEALLSQNTISSILAFERAYQLDTVLFHRNQIYNRGGYKPASFYENEIYRDSNQIKKWNAMTFNKALFITPKAQLSFYHDKAHAYFKADMITTSSSTYLEIMPQGASKGAAAKAVLKKLNISPNEAMAFGDNLNDLSLLNSVKVGFVMENATPSLKKHFSSPQIIPSNAKDGVNVTLKEWFQLSK